MIPANRDSSQVVPDLDWFSAGTNSLALYLA